MPENKETTKQMCEKTLNKITDNLNEINETLQFFNSKEGNILQTIEQENNLKEQKENNKELYDELGY